MEGAASSQLARERWLGDVCGQVAALTSLAWWTAEVGAAFDQLELGHEAALHEAAAAAAALADALCRMVMRPLQRTERAKARPRLEAASRGRESRRPTLQDRDTEPTP